MGSDFRVKWNEDGSATVLGRITARDGSGSATGVDGEGNWLEQADIDTITYKVFDRDSDTPDTPVVAETSLTVADVMLDTPVTTAVIWTKDTTGYNFIHDIAASVFTTGGHQYEVEYKVTTTGGTVFHGKYRGTATPIRYS